MKILSIYWGICSSVSLAIDGVVVAATHEERFSRKKNDDAFPRLAIDDCLKRFNLQGSDLDYVVVCSKHQDRFHQWTRPALWNIKDYIYEQKYYWLPNLLEGKELDYNKIMSHKCDSSQYPTEYWSLSPRDESIDYATDRGKILAAYLNISYKKVKYQEHHHGHALYSYLASGWKNKEVLALTVDGQGDGLNATISKFDKNGNHERIYATNQCSIARIYRYMTLLLGMKPNEHEFKVMGLAPYGKPKYSMEAYNVFAETLDVEGIEFVWKIKPTDSYQWFKERLEGIRFDSIAWGLQKWVEELLCKWVANAISHTKIQDVVIAGGVAMNIKAMGEVAKIESLQNLFVGGSASDESLVLSAPFSFEDSEISSLAPINHLYLGPNHSEADENEALATLDLEKYTIEYGNENPERIAQLLVEGKILARSVGHMEFGQRALGNRSILADPTLPHVKETINAMVKNRDFWMPFAPMVLPQYADKYLINPKGLRSPYMTIGFETTSLGFESMRSACHPSDHSARPQIIENNPELIEILEAFETLSGRGALLNTSFNLHGFPIVNTALEALYVLDNSGLNGLILNHALVIKKG